MSAIAIHQLSKSYGSTRALQAIDFEVKEGELFGLIGPDGAGKTSLIRILCTLLLADSGSANVLGYDVVKDYKEIRKKIGYMPGRFSIYYDLSVEENITLFATLFGTTLEENYELVKDIYQQIEPFKKRKAGALSGGMKQKLALSCALIHRPEILLLDEPTTGVDAVSRREFWAMLQRLKEFGITILVSTPYMDEASLCERVALIQEGQILQIDSPTNIVQQFGKKLYAIQSADTYQLLLDLRTYPHTDSVFAFGDHVHYTDQRSDFQPAWIKDYLQDKQHQDIEAHLIEPNIEDCFMALMQADRPLTV